MTGVVLRHDVSSAKMDGGGLHKRKRLEHIVESPVILGQSSQYYQADYDSQGECSKKVCATAQESSTPDKHVLGVRQQGTVNAHTGSIQPAQPAHSALLDPTSELSKASCETEYFGNVTAEQVCFGMVRDLNPCRLLPLR